MEVAARAFDVPIHIPTSDIQYFVESCSDGVELFVCTV